MSLSEFENSHTMQEIYEINEFEKVKGREREDEDRRQRIEAQAQQNRRRM